MKFLFKERVFSWLDSFDVYDEEGNVKFIVQGKLDWGHRLEISDNQGNHLGTVKEEVLTFLPKFSLYDGEDNLMGQIKKEFTFFKPVFTLDCNDWSVEGDIFEWNYNVVDGMGNLVMNAFKQLLNWSDTYILDVENSKDTLLSLMIVLAIDAAKCSDN